MTLFLPDTGPELLLWAQILVAWMVANYSLSNDPTGRDEVVARLSGQGRLRWVLLVFLRALAVAVVTILLSGPSAPAFALAAILFAGSLLLPLGRVLWIQRANGGEIPWELGLSGLVVVGTAHLVAVADLTVAFPLLRIPMADHRLAVILLVAAAVLFAGKGGTHLVRGVLDRVGTVPRLSQTPTTLDVEEYNRGRLIGVLERLLLIIAVVLRAYEALALLVAAKGLVRMDDLRKRAFAEYFLVGTLVSLMVAFVLGLLLQVAIAALW